MAITTRTSLFAESDRFKDRTGYQFCDQLQNTITTISPILKADTFIPKKTTRLFHEDKKITDHRQRLVDIKSKFETLLSSYANLNTRMRSEENEKKDYLVPQKLDAEIQKYESQLLDYDKDLLDLKSNYLQETQQIQTRLEEINQQLNRRRDKVVLTEVKEIAKENSEENQIINLHKAVDEAKLKLDAKCCSCFPCCVKKEMAELKKAEIELSNKEKEQEGTQKLLDAKTDADKKEKTLLSEIETLNKKRDELTTKHPKELAALQAKIEEIDTAKTKITGILKNQVTEYFAETSKENLMMYLHAYAAFALFQAAIEDAWNKKLVADFGQVPENDPLSQIKKSLSLCESNLLQAIYTLWYMAGTKITGKMLYQNYSALSEADKTKFVLNNDNNFTADRLYINAHVR